MKKLIRKVRDTYYNIKNGIPNIIKWIPTIWKLRDWDADFLYLLINKHLTHVEKSLRKYGNGVNSIKYANQIKIAKNLAKRLYENDYLNNASIPVERKYGEIKCHFELTENKLLSKLVFDETIEERKSRDRAGNHSELMEKQDKEMLFIMLQKKIHNWWE